MKRSRLAPLSPVTVQHMPPAGVLRLLELTRLIRLPMLFPLAVIERLTIGILQVDPKTGSPPLAALLDSSSANEHHSNTLLARLTNSHRLAFALLSVALEKPSHSLASVVTAARPKKLSTPHSDFEA